MKRIRNQKPENNEFDELRNVMKWKSKLYYWYIDAVATKRYKRSKQISERVSEICNK